MTWGDTLAILGIAVPGSVALFLGLRSSRTEEKTGLAAQVETIGKRLDATNARLDESEAREGKLIRYVYVLQRTLNDHGIAVPEPPAGLDL